MRLTVFSISLLIVNILFSSKIARADFIPPDTRDLSRVESAAISDTFGVVNSYGVKSRWQIFQNGYVTIARDIFLHTQDTLFIAEHSHDTLDGTSEENEFEENYDVRFLFGPYLSYAYGYSGTGGAHPTYGSWYRTIGLYDKQAVPLDDIFPPADIFAALMKDTVIVAHLTNKDPRDLHELTSSLDGGCEMEFDSLLTRYVFTGASKTTVGITFGLTHGCEALRGNFTEISIILPMVPELEDYLPDIH
jgi:hypothetical protein